MVVLNISNVTSKGGIVLNDLKLLELIQKYPFLYNRRVHPHDDPDYDGWAWENITTSFNSSYNDTVEPFSTESLQSRWLELQPIVISLSKVYDINVIPHALRQIVLKIAVQLEDKVSDGQTKVPSMAESIILENIAMVGRLPLKERKKLEAEVMDLLLNTELSSKATVKLSTIDMSRIEQQYECCLIDMGLKKFPLDSAPDPIGSNIDDDQTREEEDNSLAILQTILCDNSNSNPPFDDAPTIGENEMRSTPPLLQRRSSDSPAPEKEITDSNKKNKKRLLHNAAQMRQFRPCVVRLKRFNFDSYLQTSKVKKEY